MPQANGKRIPGLKLDHPTTRGDKVAGELPPRRCRRHLHHQLDRLYHAVATALDALLSAVGLKIASYVALREQISLGPQ
jgi:hypothetical protein